MPSKKTPAIAGNAAALREVPQRIVSAWADNDAKAFADAFAEDASLILPNDIYLSGREEIRSFMAKGFAGPYKGTKVFGIPISARQYGNDVIVIVTRGGVIAAGESELAAENAIRATWVMARQGQDWLIVAYQNTPIGKPLAAAAKPEG